MEEGREANVRDEPHIHLPAPSWRGQGQSFLFIHGVYISCYGDNNNAGDTEKKPPQLHPHSKHREEEHGNPQQGRSPEPPQAGSWSPPLAMEMLSLLTTLTRADGWRRGEENANAAMGPTAGENRAATAVSTQPWPFYHSRTRRASGQSSDRSCWRPRTGSRPPRPHPQGSPAAVGSGVNE